MLPTTLTRPIVRKLSPSDAQRVLIALRNAAASLPFGADAELCSVLEERLSESSALAVWLRDNVRLELHSEQEASTIDAIVGSLTPS
jgi:hypothetical protein